MKKEDTSPQYGKKKIDKRQYQDRIKEIEDKALEKLRGSSPGKGYKSLWHAEDYLAQRWLEEVLLRQLTTSENVHDLLGPSEAFFEMIKETTESYPSSTRLAAGLYLHITEHMDQYSGRKVPINEISDLLSEKTGKKIDRVIAELVVRTYNRLYKRKLRVERIY